jgi:hypothetical protein
MGLALGICACIVIYLITAYEFSFDKFHPDGNRIYRIVGELQKPNGYKEFLNSPISDVAGFQDEIPGFAAKAGFYNYGDPITITDGEHSVKKFDNRIDNTYTPATIITPADYFSVFYYQWLQGNKTVLNEPFTVVLSEKSARQYFGDIPLLQIIGKTVTYGDSLQVHVAGIVKDWAGNTDFGYTDFISISTATHSFLKNEIPTADWNSLSPHRSMAFVKLDRGTTAAQIDSRFASFIKKHIKAPEGASLTMRLQPLSNIHFTTDFHRGDDGDSFRKPYRPTLFAIMGVAMLFCFLRSSILSICLRHSLYNAQKKSA